MPRKQRGLYETLITEALEAELVALGDRLHGGPLGPRQGGSRRPHRAACIASARARHRIRLTTTSAWQWAHPSPASSSRSSSTPPPRTRSRPNGPSSPPASYAACSRRCLTAAPRPCPRRSSRCSTRRCSRTRRASRASAASSSPRSHSADRIDVVMAFIRRSGIAPLLEALRAPLRGRAAAARPDDDLHRLDRGAGARCARATSAPRCGSRTTRPARGCTRRRGCSIAAPASRPPTSARRTSPTRRR